MTATSLLLCVALHVLHGARAQGQPLLQLLSKRAQALGGTGFGFEVRAGGGAVVTVSGSQPAATFALTSSFSEPGTVRPTWRNLTAGHPDGSWMVTVDRSKAKDGQWRVTAKADGFTLARLWSLDPPSRPVRILVNDSFASSTGETIGIHVRHLAHLVDGGGGVDNVQVPGRFEVGMCGTDGPDGNSAIFGNPDYEAHSTNFGAPHIWLNTSGGAALGMVALDDVFRVHAQQRQYAMPSLNPRVQMQCPVSSPPSIELSDPFFGLGSGTSYTEEWAVYPFGTECPDWFCFVNALRHGFETDTVLVGEHSGSLSILENSPTFDIDAGAHAGNMMVWNGTGYADPRCGPWGPKVWPYCTNQPGFWGTNWTDWSSAQLQEFSKQHGTTVFACGVSTILSAIDYCLPHARTHARTHSLTYSLLPLVVCAVHYKHRVGNGWVPGVEMCRACRMENNGADFVYNTSPDFLQYIPRVFAAAKRASTPGRTVGTTYYFHSFISTGINDSITYADSRILDKDFKQIVYLTCNRSAGGGWAPVPQELPLFFGTPDNSYGSVLEQYVQKTFDLGFTGVCAWPACLPIILARLRTKLPALCAFTLRSCADLCVAALDADHDEYGESNTAYTYSPTGEWDGHSVFTHPNGSVRATVGSIALLTMPTELKLQEIIKKNHGFLTANGAPLTRTIMQRKFGMHFAENGEELVAQKVQSYTPIMLNRPQGLSSDLDPKYATRKNAATYDPVFGAGAVCWNIFNHLDDGVLSEQYQGTLPRMANPHNTSTILTHLYPMTPIELGDGFVIGKEKVLTKASGIFRNGRGSKATVYLYEECMEVAAFSTRDRKGNARGGPVQILPGEVTIQLRPNQAAVVVWELPSETVG